MPLTVEEIKNKVRFHKATIEGVNATLPMHSHLRRLFTQVMTELNEVLPDGTSKDCTMTLLETTSMWAHKTVAELAPLVSENQSQDTAELEREQRLKDLLENMLVDHWAAKTDHRSDESKREFLIRMLAAGFVKGEDFNAIYGSPPVEPGVVYPGPSHGFPQGSVVMFSQKNVDTPVLEKPSAVEMRSWILNNLGHVRGLCKLPDDSDRTFIEWLSDHGHITVEQYKTAYPDPSLAEINQVLAKQFEGLQD